VAKLSRQAVVETLEKESYLVPVERLGKVAQVSQADSDSQESVVRRCGKYPAGSNVGDDNIIEAHCYVEYQVGLVNFQFQT